MRDPAARSASKMAEPEPEPQSEPEQSPEDRIAWLREHGRSRFLLTAPPLRLPGIVG